MIKLSYNINFDDLYTVEGIKKVDQAFCLYLSEIDRELADQLSYYRAQPASLNEIEYSNFLISVSPFVEQFLARLFNIEEEVTNTLPAYRDFNLVYQCKRLFVQRYAVKKYTKDQAESFNAAAITFQLINLLNADITDSNFAKYVDIWQKEPEQHKDELEIATKYAAYQVHCNKNASILFTVPKKIEFPSLLDVGIEDQEGRKILSSHAWQMKSREGFKYSGGEISLQETLDQTHYCIYCHKQNKDSCSKGLKETTTSSVATATFKKNEGGVSLSGCPLEQKISEMNLLKSQGHTLAALAVITVDNPMLIATGHRICNDCMKACIYQKQDPVNIPKIETRILEDVLSLPYGFEIYSLLTRWNPLKLTSSMPKDTTKYKVLVVGLGPAGFTLAHYLLNEGHLVYAIDGLKIEPLAEELLSKTAPKPIKFVNELWEDLDRRKSYGFGGVVEYGITVRFDKNYLMLARLLLERRQNFTLQGGIRLGSNITIKQAFELGFDHIALCLGAGKPNIPNIPNILAKGVRTASDFLMTLQLTGAAREDSLASLTVRLPICIIGGGLTAIDTASEALAYYPVQVEKFLSRYEIVVRKLGRESVEASWTEGDKLIAYEFMEHAKVIRQERQQAALDGREPNILQLLLKWGGAIIYYRKSLQESPAYRLNHEEIAYAFHEGIKFCQDLAPYEIKLDRFNYAEKLILKDCAGVNHEVFARTILIATGTTPNIKIADEEGSYFKTDKGYFALNLDKERSELLKADEKFSQEEFVIERSEKGSISYFGDLHPSFAGNVVKAMASAKNGYPKIAQELTKRAPKNLDKDFTVKLKLLLTARIHQIIRLAPNIIEIILKAPLAAKNFQPGQFYRLQNYEADALNLVIEGIKTTLATEPLALTGAWVDKENGLISTIVLEMGASSKLCHKFVPGQEVILMGPTGAPTELKSNETVMLAGGGLGNAVLFSIGKALRAMGSKVIYFAAYRKSQDRFKMDDIHAAADIVVWCCEEAVLEKFRSEDYSFKGNIIDAMHQFASQEPVLNDINRIIAIGSNRMMEAIAKARRGILAAYLPKTHQAIASINSPMQCMMKEICAQCLQKHINPETGEEYYVFSCSNQDQDMDKVSFEHLNDRLTQNSVQEKLTSLWVEEALASLKN
ncbi:MAG: putative bifunctional glutamate synthase subunit beta/2-polyprenylphenol hydroxylase [Rickettsiaceae bacterium]|jgi:NADPH-dependent glutamate synthase beta subunit-like oxidoreductase/NAD(P)H-flavin reductase|nr:putative bifunctional glutamate synthase subunit beta/2-polyprenylphenol hydroxylase [Rickettsiaceae bacterium]